MPKINPVCRLSTLLLLLLVFSAAQAVEPIKSPNDPRLYQAFTLENQLRVLLISDPATDKAAAALDVHVGSDSDPDDRAGLAHFLEHMLFLGTEKYPDPGDYKQFLASHGGNHNAYTADRNTNYFFDVDKDFLEPALDRFAQFFIAPLFTEKYVGNERQVVHSEYQSKLGSDGWRIHSAQREAMNPAHPAARFSVGSDETLADRPDDPVRADLIAFYRQHYSANLMTLVVLGKQPLAQLRSWVEAKFSAIPNTGAEPLEVDVPLFDPGRLPARLDVTTLQDEQRLTLTFPLPPVQAYFRSKPLSYLSNLLGHEGEGSLLALLKHKGWADSLWAGPSMSTDSEAAMTVSIGLTRSGLDRIDDIVDLVFRELRLIDRDGIDQWRYHEQSRLAEIDFRFQERSEPLSYVRSLAAALQDYPSREVLRGPYLMSDYDPQLIRRFLERMTPDNMLVTVSAPDRQTDAIEPYFNVAYRLRPIAGPTLSGWREASADTALALPPPNPFIPEQLALKPPPEQPAAEPRPILEKPGLTLWYQQDTQYRVPRAEFYVSVRSPVANDTAAHAMLTELYVRAIKDQLNAFAYPAYLAGLNFRLYRHIRGFTLRISGYDAKQPLLLERIAAALRDLHVKPEVFDRIKEDLSNSLTSARREPPYRQALTEISDLLVSPNWTEAQKLAALEPLTVTDLRNFVPDLLGRIELLVLAYGNLTPDEARSMTGVLEDRLLAAAEPVEVPRGQLLKLEGGRDYTRQLDIDNNDSAVTMYFQGAARGDAARARFALLAEMLDSPFFETLRTEQKLGYIVFVTGMPILEVPGLAFVVQSPSTDPAGLEQHIDRFLDDYAETLASMPPVELQRLKASVRSRILERDKTLQDRADYYWTELDRDQPRFDTRQTLAEAVAAIGKDELLAAYRRLLLGPQRHRLVVRSAGDGHADTLAAGDEPQTALIRDVDAFKASLEHFSG